jgi:endoglucanase
MRVYQDLVIGVDYPLEHWYQAWKILVLRYKDHPALAGYGIMGEPYELPYSYTEVAQNAINSIRFIDQTTPIVVSGDCWSSIGPEWNDCNAPLLQLIDPSNRLIVDGHLFLDPDGSGRYDCLTPIECGVLSGVDKVSQFVSWCSIHQMRCWVGSFGVPMRVGNWENITFQVVEYVLKHDIGIAFWGGGDVEWWGDYLLLIEGVEWLYPVFQR